MALTLLATCEGYMNYKQEISVEPALESEQYVLQFPLPSLNIPVLVRNVFYEFDKATITPQSIPALEGLVGLLKQNPSIAIELSSHCDYRGSDEYNIKLSQARAESVVNYLITHGIEKGRVVAKGYGKSRPKIITKKFAERYPFLNAGDTLTVEYIKTFTPEQQDSCNALNRRTEFSVLKTTYGLLDKQGNLDTTAVKKAEDKAEKAKAEKIDESAEPAKPAEQKDEVVAPKEAKTSPTDKNEKDKNKSQATPQEKNATPQEKKSAR